MGPPHLANVDGSLTLLEPKTDRSRRLVILPEAVRVELRAHRTRQKLDRLVAGLTLDRQRSRLRHDARASPTTPRRSPAAFTGPLARAELPDVRFHDLRHSRRRSSCRRASTLEDVKNLLGHSTIVLTSNTYGHVLEQRQQEMARGMDAVLGG